MSSFRIVYALAVCAALSLPVVTAAAHADRAASLTPAQRRALLMDPTRPFWRTRAPDTVVLDMKTSEGAIAIELIREWAPHGVDRFYNLARAGFFDDSRFYRVIMFYIAQFGHPASPAVGSVWRNRKLPPDSVRGSNVRGTVTYAQFTPRDRTTTLFINLNDNGSLDSLGFAPVGRVIEGMDVADRLYTGYGELPASPAPLGNPRRFHGESNRFLDKEYPELSRIISITVRSDTAATPGERD
ncbi:MAG TPA: peptidylprolyl isomerase [Gemmatimonadaceae bacterium]|nr:peptidylprolyl isomerase [Gemmatimonadaceae bacterium]